ncbi:MULTISPECIES: alpha/beta hydrolase-fold protein [unclassified Tenacibaculum]|uniref:alpha/beta hydrolase-fold protein n=1 Tax=unclassified Tenacibaculum TaxID=2635139 RepID=UPI001EEC28B3|nr:MULTISPECIES: alpha/beta hydrolase-fold protein [unclassified Tenacibaculum]MCF2875117.1 esterase [Tenacibaculum sp. Cn5-1]MCF2935193.1 esterase [Tenacibaculum sp. Cn5-34]MCG7511365.1 esterase [Tenacibaculum sp. Cn5-46]
MVKQAILILTLLVTFHSYSQKKGDKITIGTDYIIESTILNENREIQVYLPDSYNSSKERYPVMYILDGQWFFTNGVGIQKSLRTPGAIPEMIIVGIKNKNPLRRTLFNNERTKFTSFLEKEVISFIDSNFRTTNERIIYGWEAAAYYVSKLILEKSELFTGAIITDGGFASEKIIKNFKSTKDVYLYIANSKKDIYYIASTEAFSKGLKEHNPENLLWKYELFNDEVHETMPHLAMYKGIMYYYHNYDSLVFESIEAYEKAGGIPYLKSFFKERAKRFGGNGKIDNSTKNSLIWLAWRRDNFKYFSFFMEEFKDVLDTRRYDSAYWKNRLAQFYLKHKDYKNAVKFFEEGIKKYPKSEFDKLMKEGLKIAKNKL